MKKKNKKNKPIWPSGGGDAGAAGGRQASLSLPLSVMWSKEMPECSWWGEKENKKKGAGHLCGGEKQEKEKRKNKRKRGWKGNGWKKNNIKNKKILIENIITIFLQYFHNKF